VGERRGLRGQATLWIDLCDKFVGRGCLQDDYEPAETNFIRKNLKPGDTFVDIGANVGWHTLGAALLIGEQGRVFAFEPRQPTVTYLRRSIADNGLLGRVQVFDCGLSDRCGEARLAWAKSSDNPGGSFLQIGSDAEGFETQSIELRRLDDVLGRRHVHRDDAQTRLSSISDDHGVYGDEITSFPKSHYKDLTKCGLRPQREVRRSRFPLRPAAERSAVSTVPICFVLLIVARFRRGNP
jgi:FkbM family methyltransferase